MIPFLSRLRKQDQSISQLAAEYYLGSGVSGRGAITTDSDIYIDCDFDGELTSEGVVEIDVNATVRATVRARTLILHGHLNGDTEVKERAVIANNATLAGKLSSSVIEIQPGAIVSAHVLSQAKNS